MDSSSRAPLRSRRGGTADDSLKRTASLEDGVFGVLFTLSKDKNDTSTQAALFTLMVEFLQLISFPLSPAFPWGWGVAGLMAQLQSLQLQNPLIALGYTAYLCAFWLLAAVLLTCLAICVYVGYSFRENKFQLVWPIIFVRQVVSLLITLLFPSTLNTFLVAFNCKYTDPSLPAPMLMRFGTSITASGGMSYTIPCWSMPHGFTAGTGVVMATALIALALVVSLVNFEANVRSSNPLGSADARVETLMFAAKTSLAVATALMSTYLQLLAIVFVISSFAMCGSIVWLLPHRASWVNRARAGLMATLAFSAIVLNAVVVRNAPNDNTLVLVEALGAVPAFMLGWSLVALREWYIDGRRVLANPRALAIVRASAAASAGDDAALTSSPTAPSGLAAGLMHVQRVVARLLLVAGVTVVPAAAVSRRSPFTSPSQVELATRFVWGVNAKCSLPDEIVAEVGRCLGNSSASEEAVGEPQPDSGASGSDDTHQIPVAPGGQRTCWCCTAHAAAVQRTGGSVHSEQSLRKALQSALLQAQMIFRHGLAVYPDSASLHLAYAAFLIAYCPDGDAQAKFHVERARKCNTGFQHRFQMFVRDTEKMHQLQGEAVGDSSMDLVSFVEFQSNMESATRLHKATMRSIKRFWRHVAAMSSSSATAASAGADSVSVSDTASVSSGERSARMSARRTAAATAITSARTAQVQVLAHLFGRVDALEAACTNIYALLLDKYPRSVDLLKAYAAFATEVLNDRKKAARALTEATRLEDQQRNAKMSVGDAHSRDEGLIVISDHGIIKSVNRPVLRMFGYSQEKELLGKPVSILMPAPHSHQHGSYISNYLATGVSHVLGQKRRLEGRRRDGTTFPLSLQVSQVETAGGIAFAGVITPLTEDTSFARIAINRSGIIQSVSSELLRMFGYESPTDLIHKNVSMLMPARHAAMHDGYLAAFFARQGQGALSVAGRRLEGVHRAGYTFPITISVDVHGSGEDMVLDGVITELTNEFGLVTITESGEILSANTGAQKLWGYGSERDLLGRNVSFLLPLPYRSFHDGYLFRYMTTGRGSVVGHSRFVPALHKDGSEFLVQLEVNELKDAQATDAAGKRSGGGILAGKRAAAAAAAKSTVSDAADDAASENGIAAALSAGLRVFMAKVTLVGEDGNTLTAASSSASQRGKKDALIAHVSTSLTGDIVMADETANKLFGYESGKMIGMNITSIMPEDVALRHDSFLKRYREQRTPRFLGVAGRHFFARRRDGTLFPISLRVVERARPEDTHAHVHQAVHAVREVDVPPPLFADEAEAAAAVSGNTRTPAHADSAPAPVWMPSQHPPLPPGFAGGGCPVVGIIRREKDGSFTRTPLHGTTASKSFHSLAAAAAAAAPAPMPAPAASSQHEASSTVSTSDSGNDEDLMTLLGLPPHPLSGRRSEGSKSPPSSGASSASDPPPPGRASEPAAASALEQEWQDGQVTAPDWAGYDAFIYPLEELEGVVTINATGTMVQANSAITSIFGYWPHELIGHNVKLLMPAAVAAHHDDYLAGYKNKKTKKMVGNRRVVEALHKDGTRIKIMAEIAERRVTRSVARGGGPVQQEEQVFFVARLIVATQARTELETQAQAALKRLVVNNRKRDKGRRRSRRAVKQTADASSDEDAAPQRGGGGGAAETRGNAARRGLDIAAVRGMRGTANEHVAVVGGGGDGSESDTVPGGGAGVARASRGVTWGAAPRSSFAAASAEEDALSMPDAPELEETGDVDDGDRVSEAGSGDQPASSTDDSEASVTEAEIARVLRARARAGGGAFRSDGDSSVTGDSSQTGDTPRTGSTSKPRSRADDAGGKQSVATTMSLGDSSSMLAQHRERQLKHISRYQRISHATRQLFTVGSWMTVMLCIVVTVSYAVLEVLVSQHRAQLRHIRAASMAARLTMQLSTDARRFALASAQLAAAVNSSSGSEDAWWYSGSPQCVTDTLLADYTRSRDRITSRALTLSSTAEELFVSAAAATNVRDSRWQAYTHPLLLLTKYVSVAVPYTLAVRSGLWESTRQLSTAAQRVALLGNGVDLVTLRAGAAAAVGRNATVPCYGYSANNASMPPAATTGLATVEEYRWVVGNGGSSSYNGWLTAVASERAAADVTAGTALGVHGAVFALQLAAPLALLIIMLRPLLARVAAERAAMFAVFLHIPRDIVLRASKQMYSIPESSDDSSDNGDAQPTTTAPSGATVAAAAPAGTKGGRNDNNSVASGEEEGAPPTAIQRTNTGRSLASMDGPSVMVAAHTPQRRTLVVTSLHSSLLRCVVGSLRSYAAMPLRARLSIVGLPCLIVAFFTASYLLIQSATNYTSVLAVAGARAALVSAVQHHALELVLAASASASLIPPASFAVPASSSETGAVTQILEWAQMTPVTSPALDDYVSSCRAKLKAAVTALQQHHNALQYGDAALGLTVQVATASLQPSLLYTSTCLRSRSTCVEKTHPYARILASGMHELVQLYSTAATQLANSSVAAIAANTRSAGSSAPGQAACTGSTCVTSGTQQAQLELIWTMAESDLADGMDTALDLYQASCEAFIVGHTALNASVFVALLLALGVVQFAVFRPHIMRINAESHRAASLLRSLPDDVDLARLRTGGASVSAPGSAAKLQQ